jgi:hypothetical protein
MLLGLGRLQKEILNTLEAAKVEMSPYCGGASWGILSAPFYQPGWVKHLGAVVQLADGLYDLRASLRFLARSRGQMYSSCVYNRFKASFSRAVRLLFARGLLEAPSLVPIKDWEGTCRVHQLVDGNFMLVSGRQRRFVRLRRLEGEGNESRATGSEKELVAHIATTARNSGEQSP